MSSVFYTRLKEANKEWLERQQKNKTSKSPRVTMNDVVNKLIENAIEKEERRKIKNKNELYHHNSNQ